MLVVEQVHPADAFGISGTEGTLHRRDGHHPDRHPLRPLVWLANFLSAREEIGGLKAGQIVTTGSYAGALEVPAATSGQAVLSSGITVMIAMAGMFFAGNKVFEFIFWLAFFLPALTVTLSWILLVDPQFGLINQALRKVGGTPVKLEVTYRQPLGQYMRLVAGHFPAASAAAVPVPQAKSGNIRYSLPGALLYAPLMQVVVTQHTAATFGLRVGSKMQVPGSGALTSLTTITLQVSGIVAPTDPRLPGGGGKPR